ncbi:hypothetical protein EV363DRAFT_1387596 [Boletus edulis]|nr:hypothetical protein EV363DRAFT_1387596 [Boletus edulis]
MVSRCVLTFCGCVLAFLIGGRLDRLTWHGLDLSRSRIARLGFPLRLRIHWGGIDRELILSLPFERYADRLG